MKERKYLNIKVFNVDNNLDLISTTLRKEIIYYFNLLGKKDDSIDLSEVKPKRVYFIAEIFDVEETKK